MRLRFAGLLLALGAVLVFFSSTSARSNGDSTIIAKSHLYVRRSPVDLAPEHQYISGWELKSPSGELIKSASTTSVDGKVLVSGGQIKQEYVFKDHVRGITKRFPITPKNSSPKSETFTERMQENVRSGKWSFLRNTIYIGREVAVYQETQPITDEHRKWTAPFVADLTGNLLQTTYTIDQQLQIPIKVEMRVIDDAGVDNTLVMLEEQLEYKVLLGDAFPDDILD